MPMPLCPAECVVLQGLDAIAFAHAQFTTDVKSQASGTWQWSAWLDAQGRVRFLFALIHVEPATLIVWLPLGDASAMRDALARFVMRAKVEIEVRAGWQLHALQTDEFQPVEPLASGGSSQVAMHAGGIALALPGAPARVAWLAPGDAATHCADALNRWRRADIACGLPWLAQELSGEFVPQALDLERLDAIRFDKGCYPGQEIAARLHFRGGNKRHLRRLRIDGAAPSPAAHIIGDEGSPIGKILYSAALSDNESVALGVVAWPRDEALHALVAGAHVGTDD